MDVEIALIIIKALLPPEDAAMFTADIQFARNVLGVLWQTPDTACLEDKPHTFIWRLTALQHAANLPTVDMPSLRDEMKILATYRFNELNTRFENDELRERIIYDCMLRMLVDKDWTPEDKS